MKEVFHSDNDVDIFMEDGIFFCVYGKDAVITLDMAKKVVHKKQEFLGDKMVPGISDGRQVKYLTREARAYFNTKGAHTNFLAGALIYNTVIQKIFVNSYIHFTSHPFQVRAFTDISSAIRWLEPYKEHEVRGEEVLRGIFENGVKS